MTEDDDQPASVFVPRKSKLSRQAVEKNTFRRSMGASLHSEQAFLQQNEIRPSYSMEHLKELKSSTPSTPKDLQPASTLENEENQALDLAAKFGSDLSVYENSAIPTDAEIQEKKQRRARLAKEEEYITLHGSEESDDNSNEITLRPSKEKPETRLIRDDEDIAEGFDDFVEDGRIAMSRRAEREQKRKKKAEIQDLIKEAEGGSSDSDETDDSEIERRRAFEGAQTRAGMDGLQKDEDYNQPQRPRTPPRITPLPTLNGCLEKLQANLTRMQHERSQKMKEMEALRKERDEIAQSEVRTQELLNEAAEKVKSEIGGELPTTPNGLPTITNGTTNSSKGQENIVQ